MSRAFVKDFDEFTEIWNAASSPSEVAKHYNMSAQAAFVWAARLRKQGYHLKVYQRKLDDSLFVEIHQSSSSLDEVSQRSGLSKASCRSKAYALRAKGHELKKFKEAPEISTRYMAGLFDASGYLAIREREQKGRAFYAVKAVLSINDRPLLEKVMAQYGGTIQARATGHVSLDWNSRDSIEKLLSAIQPHLIVMTDKAKEMLDFIEKGDE